VSDGARVVVLSFIFVCFFCFFQYSKYTGPLLLIRWRIWPSIQKVWRRLPLTIGYLQCETFPAPQHSFLNGSTIRRITKAETIPALARREIENDFG